VSHPSPTELKRNHFPDYYFSFPQSTFFFFKCLLPFSELFPFPCLAQTPMFLILPLFIFENRSPTVPTLTLTIFPFFFPRPTNLVLHYIFQFFPNQRLTRLLSSKMAAAIRFPERRSRSPSSPTPLPVPVKANFSNFP